MSCITQHKTKEELSNWLMENASDNETTGFLDMLAGDIWDMMTAETDYKALYEAEVKITHMKTEVNYSLGRAIQKHREKNKKLQQELEEEKSGREHDVQQFQSVLEEKGQLEAEVEELKEEIKKQKKEHIQHIMKTNRIATELYREVKYALGYGEFDEPDRKVMYDEIKKLKEENKKLKRANELNAELHKTSEETIRELEEENKKLKNDIKEYREWVDRNQAEIERLRDVIDGETDSEEEDDIDKK